MSSGNGRDTEYDTPVERPVRNARNRPLVLVLHNLALTLEATPRALGDIARTIQDSAEEPSDLQVQRIAHVLRDHSVTVGFAADEVLAVRKTGG